MKNLAIHSVFKNEASYLKEWIDYHRHVIGADLFLLYSNNSTDNFLEVLEPYGDMIVLKDWPGPTRKLQAFQDGLDNFRHRVRWIAFIDLDEFIYSPRDLNILDTLKGHHAVLLNWACFGNNGHQVRPPGGVIENFTRFGWGMKRDGVTPLVKTILNPRAVCKTFNVHRFVTKNKFSAPREDWRINHYCIKSLEEFHWKRNIRGNENDSTWKIEDGDYLDRFNLNTFEDKGMLQYVARMDAGNQTPQADPGPGGV